MAFAYHMEALRKQRVMDRRHSALARIAILQVDDTETSGPVFTLTLDSVCCALFVYIVRKIS